MHEFSLASSICEIVLDSARAHDAVRVREVRCRIGAMRQVVPALMRTAFEACVAETLAEGAELVIETEPVQVTCRSCGEAGSSDERVYECPACQSPDIRLAGGMDLLITSLEIDQEEDHGDSGSPERAGAQRSHG